MLCGNCTKAQAKIRYNIRHKGWCRGFQNFINPIQNHLVPGCSVGYTNYSQESNQNSEWICRCWSPHNFSEKQKVASLHIYLKSTLIPKLYRQSFCSLLWWIALNMIKRMDQNMHLNVKDNHSKSHLFSITCSIKSAEWNMRMSCCISPSYLGWTSDS